MPARVAAQTLNIIVTTLVGLAAMARAEDQAPKLPEPAFLKQVRQTSQLGDDTLKGPEAQALIQILLSDDEPAMARTLEFLEDAVESDERCRPSEKATGEQQPGNAESFPNCPVGLLLQVTDKQGANILHHTIRQKRHAATESILKLARWLRVTLDDHRDLDASTPFHLAVQSKDEASVKLLLASLRERERAHQTPCKQFRYFSPNWVQHPLLVVNRQGMTIQDMALADESTTMQTDIESVLAPLRKRCALPQDHFANHPTRRAYIEDVIKSFDPTEIRTIGMKDMFQFESGFRHLDQTEQAAYQLRVQDGTLVTPLGKDSGISACNREDIIYVLTEDRRLLAACFKPFEFHHSGLAAKKQVLGAGHLQIRDGKLHSINVASGHYAPSNRDLLQLVTILGQLGFMTNETWVHFVSAGISLAWSEILEIAPNLNTLPPPT